MTKYICFSPFRQWFLFCFAYLYTGNNKYIAIFLLEDLFSLFWLSFGLLLTELFGTLVATSCLLTFELLFLLWLVKGGI